MGDNLFLPLAIRPFSGVVRNLCWSALRRPELEEPKFEGEGRERAEPVPHQLRRGLRTALRALTDCRCILDAQRAR